MVNVQCLAALPSAFALPSPLALLSPTQALLSPTHALRPPPPTPRAQRAPAADAASARLAKKRLADRLYQRRHRAKREERTRQLETEVRALAAHVAHLRRAVRRPQPPAAVSMAPASMAPASMAQPPPAVAVVRRFLWVFAQSGSVSSDDQERFLYQVLAPQVEGAGVRGADAFVRQLRRYRRGVAGAALVPTSALRVRGAGELRVVTVDVVLRLRFRRRALRELFPALLRLERARPALAGAAERALTHSEGVAVNGTLSFVVDAAGTVAALLPALQLLEALRLALGSLERVAALVDGARIDVGSGVIAEEASLAEL